MNDVESKIDAGTFWRTLGQRAVCATIVAAPGTDGPSGFLGLSATHVSADPPTMLVSVDKRTQALADIVASGSFAVSYLPRDFESLIEIFGGKSNLKGSDRFRDGEWTTLESGAPVHKSAIGAFDCVLEETIDRGSVVLVIGRVVAATTQSGTPLVLFQGKAWRGI